MNKTQTVEEYKSPDIRFFTTEAKIPLCQSFGNLSPEYNGFKNEEDL